MPSGGNPITLTRASPGLHRALLFNGQQGWLETFRPYALPDEAWLAEAREKLAMLQR